MMSLSNRSLVSKFFPVPEYLTLDPVAIDISPKFVRMIKLVNTKDGYTPKYFEEIEMKEVCSLLENENDLDNCEELKKALITLRDKYDLEYVTISVPELKTYIFQIKLPKEALDAIEDAIKFKLEENVPLSPDDVIFNYQITNDVYSEKNTEIHVTVSALPKGVVETYTILLESLDLYPITFESESHALARAVVKEGDDTSYLLVNVGETKTNLSIVENNIVQYTSTIPVEGQKVSSDFDSPEAQSIKEQINKLLVYWFTNEHDTNSHEKIEVAILSGSHASSPDFVNFLEKHLRLSVKVAEVWQNCFSLDDYIPPINKKDSMDFGIAIGLSLIHQKL